MQKKQEQNKNKLADLIHGRWLSAALFTLLVDEAIREPKCMVSMFFL